MKLISRISAGVKKGYMSPTLPEKYQNLQLNLFRLLKILGGISFITVVTHRLQWLGNGRFYFFFV